MGFVNNYLNVLTNSLSYLRNIRDLIDPLDNTDDKEYQQVEKDKGSYRKIEPEIITLNVYIAR